MRILVDQHEFNWEEAWSITRATLSYTNHTLLPEALECWPTELFGRLLPRHLQIIYLINWHHLQEAERRGLHDPAFRSRVSLVEESGEKRVRMAHLAFLGSHAVNGVSRLHTDLLRAPYSAILRAQHRHASSTRPTESPSGVGSSRPTGH